MPHTYKSLNAADTLTRQLCENDPDKAAMRRALLKMEALAHRAGWDKPPLIGTLESCPGGYRAMLWNELCASALAAGEGHPAVGLSRIADDVCRVIELLGAVDYPEFRGLYFISETWQLYTSGKAPLAQRKYDEAMSDERMLHEHPNRREARVLSAATVDGELWQVSRVRGNKPECWCAAAIEGRGEMDGTVVADLSKLTFAIRNAVWSDIPDREL